MFPIFTGVIASSIATLSSITWSGQTRCYAGSALSLFTSPKSPSLENGVVLFWDVKRLNPFADEYFTFNNRKYVSDFSGTVVDNFECLLSATVSYSSCSALGGLSFIYTTSGIQPGSMVFSNENKSDGSAVEDTTFFFNQSAFSTKVGGEIFDVKRLVFFNQIFNEVDCAAISDTISAYVTTSGILGIGDFVFNVGVSDCGSPRTNTTLFQSGTPNSGQFYWRTNDKGRVVSRIGCSWIENYISLSGCNTLEDVFVYTSGPLEIGQSIYNSVGDSLGTTNFFYQGSSFSTTGGLIDAQVLCI